MAQRVNIVLVDDMDGSEAAETVNFGLDGATYEIDLNEDNAAALRDAFSGFVSHARKVSGGRGRRGAKNGASSTSRSSSSTPGSGRTKEMREWARAQGMAVSDRGRVPTEVQEAFEAAH